jgi:hypothetical protein
MNGDDVLGLVSFVGLAVGLLFWVPDELRRVFTRLG